MVKTSETVDRAIERITGLLIEHKFDLLLDTIETEHIEAKGSPYALSTGDHINAELAKDVAALANAGGGIILIGFTTEREKNKAEDKITSVNPFPLDRFNTAQYRDVLNDWIYPPIHSIRIETYVSSSDTSKGVAAITVPSEVTSGQPYLVAQALRSDGTRGGTLIGYYLRTRGGLVATPKTAPQSLQALLRDGMRFRDISQQLATIEKRIANIEEKQAPTLPERALPTGLADSEIQRRIVEATTAVERSSVPIIILTASPDNASGFPKMFHSEAEDAVQVLNDPPMRPDGFAVGNHLSQRAAIVKGELYRRVARGLQIIDLWQDGLLVGIGEGDYDLLCWWTRYPYNLAETEHNSLRIRNFVLAEVTLYFLELAVKIFKSADPQPQQLKFQIFLENMAVDNKLPCELSPVPDNAQNNWELRARYKSAQSVQIANSASYPFVGIDTGQVAYALLGGLYAKFGFTHDEMPYVVQDKDEVKRITLQSIMPRQQ